MKHHVVRAGVTAGAPVRVGCEIAEGITCDDLIFCYESPVKTVYFTSAACAAEEYSERNGLCTSEERRLCKIRSERDTQLPSRKNCQTMTGDANDLPSNTTDLPTEPRNLENVHRDRNEDHERANSPTEAVSGSPLPSPTTSPHPPANQTASGTDIVAQATASILSDEDIFMDDTEAHVEHNSAGMWQEGLDRTDEHIFDLIHSAAIKVNCNTLTVSAVTELCLNYGFSTEQLAKCLDTNTRDGSLSITEDGSHIVLPRQLVCTRDNLTGETGLNSSLPPSRDDHGTDCQNVDAEPSTSQSNNDQLGPSQGNERKTRTCAPPRTTTPNDGKSRARSTRRKPTKTANHTLVREGSKEMEALIKKMSPKVRLRKVDLLGRVLEGRDTEEDCVRAETSGILDDGEVNRRIHLRGSELTLSCGAPIVVGNPDVTSTPRPDCG